MTGSEYQKLAMRTCSIPYDRKEDMARHAIFGLIVKGNMIWTWKRPIGIFKRRWNFKNLREGKRMIPKLIILYMLCRMQFPEWCKVLIIVCIVLDAVITMCRLCKSK